MRPKQEKLFKNNRKKHSINEEIRSQSGKIRLIDPDTNTNGEVYLEYALEIADERGVDLVEIKSGTIPVCKLIQYDKFLYQAEKIKKNTAQHVKKQKVIKLSPNITDHDLDHKIKHIISFVEDGSKVEIIVRFHGRENRHKNFGYDILEKIINKTSHISAVDVPARENGNTISMILARK